MLIALNRLQRKVLLIILVIVVVPSLIAGVVSATWVSGRFERSLERWIREAAQVNEEGLRALQHNGHLFGDILASSPDWGRNLEGSRKPLVPAHLKPLGRELGIGLVQLYDADRRLLYSSSPLQMLTLWAPGQSEAVLKVRQGDKNLLAAVAVRPLRQNGVPRYYVVLGSLLDKGFLNRLNQLSGLRTRLFYPEAGDYFKAFSDSSRTLRVRLSDEGFRRLQQKQDYYNEKAENGRFMGLYTPIVDSTGRLEAVLFSGLERDPANEVLTDRVTMSLAIAGLGVLIGAIAGFLLSRVVVRPVEYLHQGVMQLAAQDFHAHVPIKSRDELGELAKAFNAMAESLRLARDEQRREFQKDKLTALGELSLALAHEIRNPIGVINTASALLQKSGDDATKKADLTRMIHEESLRLNQLLKNFQQLARHRHPQFRRIDPAQPLEHALRLALAGNDHVQVERGWSHGDACINADAELLQQAWSNLLLNALQAMGAKGGTLWVSSSRSAHEVLVVLEDDGPGIPVELMPRLFEPFFSTKEHGTGLGLTIANTLVEANEGRLELQPPQGSGARFVMRFPIAGQED